MNHGKRNFQKQHKTFFLFELNTHKMLPQSLGEDVIWLSSPIFYLFILTQMYIFASSLSHEAVSMDIKKHILTRL